MPAMMAARNPTTTSRPVGDHEAPVGAEEHHALEADVEEAGLLRDRLAERCEQQRHAGEDRARMTAAKKSVVRMLLIAHRLLPDLDIGRGTSLRLPPHQPFGAPTR